MEFGKVFPELCTYGKYQRLLYYFILMPIQLNYYVHIYSNLFLLSIRQQQQLDYRCNLPFAINHTIALQQKLNFFKNQQIFRQYLFIPSDHLLNDMLIESNANDKYLNLSMFLNQINYSFDNYLNQMNKCHQFNDSNIEDLYEFHRSLLSLFSLYNNSAYLQVGQRFHNQTKLKIPQIIECNYGWKYTAKDNYSKHYLMNINHLIMTKWNLICQNEWLQYLMMTIFLIGLIIGFLLHFILCNNIGYRKSYFSMLILQCLSGTLSCYCHEFKHFLLCRFLLGLSLPTISMITNDLMIEIAGICSMANIIYHNELIRLISVLLLPLISYLLDDNYQSLLLAISLPFLIFLFWWFIFPESINYQLINVNCNNNFHFNNNNDVQKLEKKIIDIAHINLNYLDEHFDETLKRRIHIELSIYREFMLSSLLADLKFDHNESNKGDIFVTSRNSSSSSSTTAATTTTNESNIDSMNSFNRKPSIISILCLLPNVRRKFIIILILIWINFTINLGINFFVIINYHQLFTGNRTITLSTSHNAPIIMINTENYSHLLFALLIFINIIAVIVTYKFMLNHFGRKFTFLICSLLSTIITFLTGFSLSKLMINSLNNSNNNNNYLLYDWQHNYQYSLILICVLKFLYSSIYLILIIWSYELLFTNNECHKLFYYCWAFGHLFLLFIPIAMYLMKRMCLISIYLSKKLSLFIINTLYHHQLQIIDNNQKTENNSSIITDFDNDNSTIIIIKYPWLYLILTVSLFISSIMSLILPETNNNSNNNDYNSINNQLPRTLLETEMYCCNNQSINHNNHNHKPLSWYSWRCLFNFQPPNIRPIGILKKPTKHQSFNDRIIYSSKSLNHQNSGTIIEQSMNNGNNLSSQQIDDSRHSSYHDQRPQTDDQILSTLNVNDLIPEHQQNDNKSCIGFDNIRSTESPLILIHNHNDNCNNDDNYSRLQQPNNTSNTTQIMFNNINSNINNTDNNDSNDLDNDNLNPMASTINTSMATTATIMMVPTNNHIYESNNDKTSDLYRNYTTNTFKQSPKSQQQQQPNSMFKMKNTDNCDSYECNNINDNNNSNVRVVENDDDDDDCIINHLGDTNNRMVDDNDNNNDNSDNDTNHDDCVDSIVVGFGHYLNSSYQPNNNKISAKHIDNNNDNIDAVEQQQQQLFCCCCSKSDNSSCCCHCSNSRIISTQNDR